MNDLITVAMGEMHMVFEDQVVKAVQDVGIHVNKEELLQALELNKKLVRCKDCKWYNGRYCFNERSCFPKAPNADDYCSYGERKGE